MCNGHFLCCLPDNHDGPHYFKCAGRYCPGLRWPASALVHPTSCSIARLADPVILALVDGYESADAVRRAFGRIP